MRLQFFNAADGDCFVVSSDGQQRTHHMLVDGGRSTPFKAHVLPRLGELHGANEELDILCVSHIDADHITGVLTLFDQLIEWRVFDFQRNVANNDHFEEPGEVRPPEVRKVWHNGFDAQVTVGSGAGVSTLTSVASILSANDGLRAEAALPAELAFSVQQGVELSRQLAAGLLNVPINPEFNGRTMRIADAPVPLDNLGAAAITLLGPTTAQLDELKNEWDDWVKDNQAKIAEIDREAADDAERMGLGKRESMFGLRGARAPELADRGKVTVPNLASIMLLVEEAGKSALLTGDGFGTDVVSALEKAGKLTRDKGFHTNVLKVPHHGSEFNSDRQFYELITADHYVISANGAHHNPDLRVVDDIVRSRVGRRAARTATAEKHNPFKLWFTNSPDDDSLTKNRAKHLRAVRSQLRNWLRRYPRMTAEFITTSSFAIAL